MVSTLSKLAFVLALAQAAAAATTARSLFPRTLIQRQGGLIDPSDIDPACQTRCSTMVTAFNNCVTNACLCTNSVMAGTADCLTCTLYSSGTPSASILAQAQAALEELEDGCAQAGDPVSSFTVSGAAGAATSVGVSATGTASLPLATASGSQSVFFSTPGASASVSGVASASRTASVGSTATAATGRITVSSVPTDASSTSDTTLSPTGSTGNSASRVGAGAFVGVAIIAGLALL